MSPRRLGILLVCSAAPCTSAQIASQVGITRDSARRLAVDLAKAGLLKAAGWGGRSGLAYTWRTTEQGQAVLDSADLGGLPKLRADRGVVPRVLRALEDAPRPLTVRGIAKRSGLEVHRARWGVQRLRELGVVVFEHRPGATVWRLRPGPAGPRAGAARRD